MLNKRIENKVIIVTGASRGIGQTIAVHCAEHGAKVAAVARTKRDLRKTLEKIEQYGRPAMISSTDVTNRHQVREMFDRVERELGPPDVLVNNAGRLAALGPTWETEAEDWWGDVIVNLSSVFICCHAVLPRMIERGRGHIVNIVGGGTRGPFPFASAYACSKAAVTRLTETLARELEETGSPVRVFALSPGFVRTEMTEQFEQTEAGQKWMSNLVERLEEGKDVPPDFAAEMVVRLAGGGLDDFNGRFFHSAKDRNRIEEIKKRKSEILKSDRRTLRVH